MDTIHEPIPRFYCSFENCTKSFVYKSYLEKHEKSHQVSVRYIYTNASIGYSFYYSPIIIIILFFIFN